MNAEVVEGIVVKPPMIIGSRLRNSGIVIQIKPSERYPSAIVVLAIWHGQFVTWVGDPEGTEMYFGHYHNTDLAAALADYAARP